MFVTTFWPFPFPILNLQTQIFFCYRLLLGLSPNINLQCSLLIQLILEGSNLLSWFKAQVPSYESNKWVHLLFFPNTSKIMCILQIIGWDPVLPFIVVASAAIPHALVFLFVHIYILLTCVLPCLVDFPFIYKQVENN